MIRILLFLLFFTFFSCSSKEQYIIEEAPSAIKGRKVVASTSIQGAVDKISKGTVIIKDVFYENISISKPGVNLHFENGGKLVGSLKNYSPNCVITGEGIIEGTAQYTEAVSNYGNLNIDCDIIANASCIVNYGGILRWSGVARSVIDYTFRTADGSAYYNGSGYCEYNSVIQNSGGTAYTEFTGYAKSELLFAFEMSGGNAKIKDAQLVSLSADFVEGSTISKYGGDLLELDNVDMKANNGYSIEAQGNVNHGVVRILNTCAANKPVWSGMNIENKHLLIIN